MLAIISAIKGRFLDTSLFIANYC